MKITKDMTACRSHKELETTTTNEGRRHGCRRKKELKEEKDSSETKFEN